MKNATKAKAVAAGLAAGAAAAQVLPDLAPLLDINQVLLLLMPQLANAQMGGLGLVIFIVQALMLLCRTKYANFQGKYRLMTVYGLSMILGMVTLRIDGLDWAACVLHSNSLAAMQIFAHQVWKHLQERPAPAVEEAHAPVQEEKAG